MEESETGVLMETGLLEETGRWVRETGLLETGRWVRETGLWFEEVRQGETRVETRAESEAWMRPARGTAAAGMRTGKKTAGARMRAGRVQVGGGQKSHPPTKTKDLQARTE